MGHHSEVENMGFGDSIILASPNRCTPAAEIESVVFGRMLESG